MFASSFTPVRTVELEPLLVEQRVRELDQGLAALGVDAEDDDWLEALYERDRSLEDLRGQGGLRLPTTDEWELACGGGSRRLFRWGSEASATRSPYDDPGPAALPNAFGLSLPSDTYAAELCASEETRGGDGGGLVCGGCTDFLPWLSLATAFDPRDALVDVSWEEMDPGIRLVRSLDLSR